MKTKSIILNPDKMSYALTNLIATPIKYREFQVTKTPGFDYIFRDKRWVWNDVETDWLLERCPLGKIGGKVNVKETWTQYPVEYPSQPEDFWYKAFLKLPLTSHLKIPPVDTTQGLYKWKHARCMPQEAVRYQLVIKSIAIITYDRINDFYYSKIVNPRVVTEKFKFYWLCGTQLTRRCFNV